MITYSAEFETLATEILQFVDEHRCLPTGDGSPFWGNALGINVERGFISGIQISKNALGDYTGRLIGPVQITPKGKMHLSQK